MSRVLNWSLYLAMSWTWCIGMFLPVVLLRAVGYGGLIAMAIPNILGAAAMAWFLRDADRSRKWVEDHEAACINFSLVTIAYHIFFAAYLIRRVAGPADGVGLGAALAGFWLMLQWNKGGKFLAAIVAFLVTAIGMIWAYQRHEIPYIAHPIPGAPTTLPPIAALWLAPALSFGFLLSPYLDLTFHHARQSTSPAEGRAAFAIGFGIFFALMLVVTVLYSGWLTRRFDRRLHSQLAIILTAHFIVHTALVITYHSEQLIPRAKQISPRQFFLFGLAVILAVLIGVPSARNLNLGLSLGELIYFCFLGFYALIFPAYVFVRGINPRGNQFAWIMTLLLSMPLYALAFVEQNLFWFLPGTAVALATKYVFRHRPRIA
jgi:hypothetical protein